MTDAGAIGDVCSNEVIIDRLYFISKNSRSLSLIEMNGGVGIQVLLDEYPVKQKNGCPST